MVKISKILLSAILFINFAWVSFAAVINNAPGKMTDPFITYGERIAQDGSIWASVFEGNLIIEARFITKLPPNEVIKLYSSFLHSDIEPFSDTYPIWRWVGDIDGEEKQLTITYNHRDQVTVIELLSYESKPYKGASLYLDYPFLGNMQGQLITSKETFSGGYSSALLMYEYYKTPSAAVRYITNKLKTYRWQDTFEKQGSLEGKQAFHVMQRKGERVGIVAVTDDDRSTVLTLIFHKTKT